MFPLIETAIAFAAAMLTASLIVSGGVQIVLSLGRYRTRGVEEMLLSLFRGFRAFNKDKRFAAAGMDAANSAPHRASERAFLHDVMADPTLQARGSVNHFSSDPNELAKMVEYIDAEDLITLAYNQASFASDPSKVPSLDPNAPRPSLPLPKSWFEDAAPPDYATTAALEAYISRWFETLEANATQRFKGRVRQITTLLAAVLVVLLNFDSIQLGRVLYSNSGVRRNLAAQAGDVAALAESAGLGQPAPAVSRPGNPASTTPAAAVKDAPLLFQDTTREELTPGVQIRRAATALDQPGIGIGWQESWIIGRFCAYRGTCGGVEPPISGKKLATDIGLWMFGLLASAVLLSFGSPFWYGVLRQMLNLGNVGRAKRDAPADAGGAATSSRFPPPGSTRITP